VGGYGPRLFETRRNRRSAHVLVEQLAGSARHGQPREWLTFGFEPRPGLALKGDAEAVDLG
jgi:hypothetical protein